MKKQILFVIPSMRCGGAEKSLLTLLTLFDCEKYDVDLLCFRHDGLFFDKIPKKINVIGGNERYEMFDGDARLAAKYFLKKGQLVSAFDRWQYSKINTADDDREAEEIQWKYLKKQLPKINKEYDCAIGHLEGNANRFVTERVKAKNKICYIHSDIVKLGLERKSTEKIFEKANRIVTVSEECKKSLEKNFPLAGGKVCVIENITSRRLLLEQSRSAEVFPKNQGETVLCTVGRCSEPKNISLAVEACAELVKRGKNIKWYHVGDGPLRGEIEKQIAENELENIFILLGEKSEPYPYMGQCDIYVQPSLYEGKSIAIDEAKCLCRPIIVTDFSTVHDQITDGVNGLICRMDKNDMADKAELLIDSREERERLSKNLKNEEAGNEKEIEKLYAIINK